MSDAGWFGQEDPQTAKTPYAAFAFLVQQLLGKAATIEPVLVKAVHGAGDLFAGTVDVQPMVHQVNGLGQVTPHGTIGGLPAFQLQGGANAIIMPPAVGDIGVALFCARDISIVKNTQAPGPPGSSGRFDWTDGLYVGGFLNGAPTQYLQFSPAGITLKSPVAVSIDAPQVTTSGNFAAGNGITGSFTTPTGQTVTVQNGIITNIF